MPKSSNVSAQTKKGDTTIRVVSEAPTGDFCTENGDRQLGVMSKSSNISLHREKGDTGKRIVSKSSTVRYQFIGIRVLTLEKEH